MKTEKTKKTLHEKKVELAKASRPSYGVYINGGDLDKLSEAIALVTPSILDVVNSDSEEKTKRLALEILKNSLPSVNHCQISNVNINMES